jgi:ParB family chromosome partitioning protein
VASDYEIHPAADIFPMMTEEEYQGLLSDIREYGQKDDAVLLSGKLLDGRNRYRACKELGIELECCELEPKTDPIAYVLSKNLHRRHLGASQRAQCAADVATLRRGRPSKTNPQDCGNTTEDAAKVFSVSTRSVETAKHVADHGDKAVVNAVKSGMITVAAAAKLVDAVPDKKEQRAILKEGTKAVKAKVKNAKPKGKRKRTSGGPARVSSGQATEPDSDAAGAVSEPDAGGEFKRRLVEFCKAQIDNIDGLSWQLIGAVLLSVGDDCPGWN